jgi:hypothetical protein
MTTLGASMSPIPTDDLANDPRWHRLWNRPWRCSACGETHQGLSDLACGKPEQWPGAEDKAPNSALDLADNFLSEDFCVLEGRHFFVRAVLELPIPGANGKRFGFGVWSTLSRENFVRYVGTFDSGEQDGLGPWFGWFSNRLDRYPDTLNLKCQVHPVSGRQRPRIELEPTSHPLAVEQRTGISFDRVLEIYALNGHDVSRSLCD